jgi:hypothetical protein
VTPKQVYAIEQVLLINVAVSEQYEKRGVSREDMREVFRLAQVGAAQEAKKKRRKA